MMAFSAGGMPGGLQAGMPPMAGGGMGTQQLGMSGLAAPHQQMGGMIGLNGPAPPYGLSPDGPISGPELAARIAAGQQIPLVVVRRRCRLTSG